MDLTHSENIILRYVTNSANYLDICKPAFFKNESFGEILKGVKEFWDKYHEIPTPEQLIESFKIQGKSDISPTEIKAIYELDLKNYDDSWLKETTEFFIEYKNLTKSAVDAVKYIQSTPVSSENIKSVIDSFKSIIIDRNNIDFAFDEGLDFFNPNNHKQLKSSTFPSGFPFIDTVLGGGFSAKSLYVFMGMPKVGKCNLGTIKGRNKRTGEVYNIKIEDLYERIKRGNNL